MAIEDEDGEGIADGAGPAAVSVLIADDHQIFVASLAALVATEEGIKIVGTAGRVAEAVAVAGETRPDVAILDWYMPDGDGVDAVRSVLAVSPSTKVLVLTGVDDESIVKEAVGAGCSGFLTKDRAADELFEAVRILADGGLHIPGEMVGVLAASVSGSAVSNAALLSPREKDVLRLLAHGRSTGAIASELGIQVNTVRNHVQSTISKMGAHSKLEAVTIALREGIVELGH